MEAVDFAVVAMRELGVRYQRSLDGTSWAGFSQDMLYRYQLHRYLGPGPGQERSGPPLVVCMFNPSTADAFSDDPTIRRLVLLAKRDGYGSVHVVNLYAWRATDPAELEHVLDPIGPVNAEVLEQAARLTGSVLCAWGALNPRRHASVLVRQWDSVAVKRHLAGAVLNCLGTTKAGHPRHPLYLPGDVAVVPWTTGLAGT